MNPCLKPDRPMLKTTPTIGVPSLETLSEKLLKRHSLVAMETQLGQTLASVLFKVVE